MDDISEPAAAISAAAIIAGLFLAVIVLYRSLKGKRRGIFLSLFLLTLCVGLSEPLLQRWIDPVEADLFFNLLGGYAFLLGPLLFLDCTAGDSSSFRTVDAIHFLPFGLYAAAVFCFRNADPLVEVVVYELFLVHVNLYCFYSMRSLTTPRPDHPVIGHSHILQLSYVRTVPRISLVLFATLGVLTNASLFLQFPLNGFILSGIQFVFIAYLFFVVLIAPEL